MNNISIAINAQFGGRLTNDQLMPMIKRLYAENKLCKCYGIGFPRKYKFTDEPLEKFDVTKIPSRLSWFVLGPLARLLHLKNYNGGYMMTKIFEAMYASKISNDESKLLYTTVALRSLIDRAQNNGKKIAVMAGISEPMRQYERITREYEKFNIKNRTIYGDLKASTNWKNYYQKADYVIAISKLSLETYKNAEYDMKKFHLIPLTGSNFAGINHCCNGGGGHRT